MLREDRRAREPEAECSSCSLGSTTRSPTRLPGTPSARVRISGYRGKQRSVTRRAVARCAHAAGASPRGSPSRTRRPRTRSAQRSTPRLRKAAGPQRLRDRCRERILIRRRRPDLDVRVRPTREGIPAPASDDDASRLRDRSPLNRAQDVQHACGDLAVALSVERDRVPAGVERDEDRDLLDEEVVDDQREVHRVRVAQMKDVCVLGCPVGFREAHGHLFERPEAEPSDRRALPCRQRRGEGDCPRLQHAERNRNESVRSFERSLYPREVARQHPDPVPLDDDARDAVAETDVHRTAERAHDA